MNLKVPPPSTTESSESLAEIQLEEQLTTAASAELEVTPQIPPSTTKSSELAAIQLEEPITTKSSKSAVTPLGQMILKKPAINDPFNYISPSPPIPKCPWGGLNNKRFKAFAARLGDNMIYSMKHWDYRSSIEINKHATSVGLNSFVEHFESTCMYCICKLG